MKNLSLYLSSAALILAVAVACIFFSGNKKAAKPAEAEGEKVVAEAGSIVYFVLDRVVAEYDMANDLKSVVETKVNNIQNVVNTRQKKLEKSFNDFNDKMNKGLMTRTTAEAQAQKLEQQKAEFEQFASQKSQEIYEEQQVMTNQIIDAIQTYVESYNTTKGYAMIIANQGGAPVITADESLDITDEIIAGLNEEYVKTKGAKAEEE